jgi:3-oxo-5-alpha-steroid 4-dehydrogenase 1
MEIIGPLNLLYILYSTLDGDLSVLPAANQVTTALYVLHYLNRAVVSPFCGAPSVSPIHVSVVVSAMVFNWVNSACLAGWMLGYRLDIEERGFPWRTSRDGRGY